MSEENSLKNNENINSDAEEEAPKPARSLGLDLGDCVHNLEANKLENNGFSAGAAAGCSEPSSKREDNPFSFKHFLRENPNKNYQSLGARPKVYRDNFSRDLSPPESAKNHQNIRKVGEFSSALPDFVQDHLVIEQSLLGASRSPSTTNCGVFNLDLPDFAQEHDTIHSRLNSNEEASIGAIPLDLPGLPIGNSFPLDLPLGNQHQSPSVNECTNNNPSIAEVGSSKSLPDFITDGPVLRSKETANLLNLNLNNETLRHHTSTTHGCSRCTALLSEVNNLRLKLGQVDEELKHNYRRANVAENSVTRLKQDVKALKSQLRQLRAENGMLKEIERGASSSSFSDGGGDARLLEIPSQRLAQELRAAASTAEHSLRSLLNGVDNLRIMASTLENLNRIEEKSPTGGLFSRFDDDNIGPAL